MSKINCPKCTASMNEIQEPDMTFDVCPDCGGKFYDHNELNQALIGQYGDLEFLTVAIADFSSEDNVIHCPVCTDQKMEKIKLMGFDSLIFDYCPNCKGFFLDEGELNQANQLLAESTEDGKSDEFRNFIDGYLLKGGVKDFATIGGHPRGLPIDSVQQGKRFGVSALFPTALAIELRLTTEKWTHKLAKLFRISSIQDIQTNNKEFDSKFLIQGPSADSVKPFFHDEVIQSILSFLNNPVGIFEKSNQFEINKYGVHYSEGPFSGIKDIDLNKETEVLQKQLLAIAKAIYNSQR